MKDTIQPPEFHMTPDKQSWWFYLPTDQLQRLRHGDDVEAYLTEIHSILRDWHEVDVNTAVLLIPKAQADVSVLMRQWLPDRQPSDDPFTWVYDGLHIYVVESTDCDVAKVELRSVLYAVPAPIRGKSDLDTTIDFP